MTNVIKITVNDTNEHDLKSSTISRHRPHSDGENAGELNNPQPTRPVLGTNHDTYVDFDASPYLSGSDEQVLIILSLTETDVSFPAGEPNAVVANNSPGASMFCVRRPFERQTDPKRRHFYVKYRPASPGDDIGSYSFSVDRAGKLVPFVVDPNVKNTG